MNGEGFIVLQRKLLDWEWFDDLNTLGVWIYILLETNWKDNSWHGMEIPRGSTLLSYEKIAQKLKISKRNVRTAIEHLKSTGEIACKSTRYGLLISVINYAKYQDRPEITDMQIDTLHDTEVTRKRHGSDTEVTPLEQSNKETKKQVIKRFITPTIEEVKAYIDENYFMVDANKFFDYYTANGWTIGGKSKMKDWKATVRNWDRREQESLNHKKKERTGLAFDDI